MKLTPTLKRGLPLLILFMLGMSASLPAAGQSIQPAEETATTQIFLPVVAHECGNCYYLDSVNGSDANSGTALDEPWQTLTPLKVTQLLPGSTVNFKRGSFWDEALEITSSGLPGQPIRFTTYGTGARPVFTHPGNGSEWTSAIVIHADWVVVEGLLTRDAHNAGVYIGQDSDYNLVRDIEATDVGIGISVLGQHNLVTNNYVHDLKMINNTPGGVNDDYGAVGVWLGNSYNEISYNRIVNCIAPSYDFGTDGGAIEWYGFADGNYVHHNWTSNNKGFLEVGGGSANDNIVAYNLSINNGRFSILHLTGDFSSNVQNFRIENNTIVETGNPEPGWVIFGFGGDPDPGTFTLRNNLIAANNFQAVSNKSAFTHDHNMYFLTGGTELGFSAEPSELLANPLFVDDATANFRLQPASPAIDRGIDLNYVLDFDNQPVFSGAAPDLGAYEHP